ncbi:MAG: hypothetical protein K2P41_08745 [Lachnospiraceae bacterium]|nr:hypothetical protein [Lachnospiraceae bacterium]
MREMMQKLNVVKYATSEEQKKELASKGFLPAGKTPGKKAAGSREKEDKGDGNG